MPDITVETTTRAQFLQQKLSVPNIFLYNFKPNNFFQKNQKHFCQFFSPG